MMGYSCTCAHLSAIRERLDGLRWNMVCGYGANSSVLYRYYEWNKLHVRTRPSLFHFSITAGHSVLKFGVLLDTHQLCAWHRFGNIYTSARAVVHHFKHIYSLSLVHGPKGVLMVLGILRQLLDCLAWTQIASNRSADCFHWTAPRGAPDGIISPLPLISCSGPISFDDIVTISRST